MKKILPVFSYLFHPLFIPFFTVLLFFSVNESYLVPAEKLLILLQVLIILVLIPVMFFFLLRTLGKIDTVMAPDVSQRKWPLIMQVALIFLLMYQSITPQRLPELFFFFLGAMLTTIAALSLAFARIKISLHMASLGAMVFFVIGLSIHNQCNLIVLIAILFVITGLVATSRLEMKAHDHAELLFGFLCGMIPQLALLHAWL